MFRKTATGLVICLLLAALLFFVGGSAMPGAFQTASAGEESPAQANGQVISPRNLTLEEALALAEENNYTLKYAKSAKRKALVEAEQARSDSSSAQLAQRANDDIKKNAKIIADKAYEVSKEQVKLKVETKYYAVLQARDLVKVDEAALERAEKQLDIAKASFTVGTVAKTDVLAAEVGVAKAKASLTSAKNSYDTAVIDLNRAIGLDLVTPLNLAGGADFTPMAEVDLAAVTNEAMATRLDVAKAEVSLENAKIKLQAIYDYYAGTNDVKIAGVDVDDAEITLEDTKNQVISDLTQAHLNVKAAREKINALQAGVDQARENVRLTNLRYQVGMATSLEVLDASVELADIEAQHVEALYSYKIAVLAFETAKLAPSS